MKNSKIFLYVVFNLQNAKSHKILHIGKIEKDTLESLFAEHVRYWLHPHRKSIYYIIASYIKFKKK